MELTAEQVGHFQEHGYLIVPRFFEAREVAAMRAEIERLKENGKLRNVATDGDGKTHSTALVNLQLCPMSPHSLLYRAMPFHPKVVAAVRALLGDPVVLHLDQVFLKPGRQGMGTNWHQDNAYFRIPDPLKGTAMWTAIHDATRANGTLEIIPDAFREALEHSRDPYSDHHIRCYPDESRAVVAELEAGGVAFFAYGTPHCTRGNATDHERAGVALHFLNGECVDPDYFHRDDRMKHPQLTGPEADDGRRTFGASMREAWKQEIARLSNA